MADEPLPDVELEEMRRTPSQDRVSEGGTRSTELSANLADTTSSRTGTSTEQQKRDNQRTGGATGAGQAGGATSADQRRSNEWSYSNKSNLQLSLDNQYQTMAHTYSKEAVESMDFLAESKDRAQITANSALSLSLVVVLKELLDQESGSKYHLVSVVLVSVCLALQVTIGLLALYMYQLKAKISVFRKRAEQTRRQIRIDPEGTVSSDEADMKRLSEAVSYSVPGGRNGAVGKEANARRVEIPRSGSLDVLPMASGTGLNELNETMIQMLTDLYADVLIDIQKIQIRLVGASDDDDQESGRLREELNKKGDVLKLIEAQLQIAELKGEMLTRREMLVKVTQIQNAITYILYVTFVINAFLTGFGIS